MKAFVSGFKFYPPVNRMSLYVELREKKESNYLPNGFFFQVLEHTLTFYLQICTDLGFMQYGLHQPYLKQAYILWSCIVLKLYGFFFFQ